MIYNEEDNQFKQAVDVLKQLPRVNAPANFEAALMRRINAGRLEEYKKESFWDILLSPARLIPSAALAAVAVIMFFVVNTSSVEQHDPLSTEPRIREDITQAGYPRGISADEELSQIQRRGENVPGTRFTTASNITKAGLNFRQIQLTDEEKAVLNKLKARIQQYMDKEKQTGK
jgi:hypothetical protein